jgi:predicted DNA-binding transcriptional regulator YafY
MGFLKYLVRLQRADELIRRSATGDSNEFAKKLGISKSQLFVDLKEMKQMGAPIKYCSIRRCYYYGCNCQLRIEFVEVN